MKLSDPFGVARGYEQYFGLVESPFGLTPNRRFLFESESHAVVVEQVTLAIRRREALMVIIGAIGSGKSLLCQTIQPLEPRTFVSVISNPRLSPSDLLRQVHDDFGLEPDLARPSGETSEPITAQLLQRLLAGLAELDAHAVIVIDDAQSLEADAFEQVRLLCSLDIRSQQLLQVILVGRLELAAVLERPELRELAARVVRSHRLQPLKSHEIAPYVERRLSVAQDKTSLVSGLAASTSDGERRRVRFTAVALRSLPALTQGVPRAVNVICDGALEIACAQKKAAVDAGCVLAAARDLKVVIPFDVHQRSRRRFDLAAPVLLVAGAGLLALHASGTAPWAAAPVPQAATVQREPATSPDVEDATVAPLPESESFSVAAAAFRSEGRAAAAASSLRLLDLPVFVRPAGGSHTVVVGPFASRQEAVEAQAQVARFYRTKSRIVSTAPTEGAFVHPPRPVAMTGSKGQP